MSVQDVTCSQCLNQIDSWKDDGYFRDDGKYICKDCELANKINETEYDDLDPFVDF